MKMRVIVRERGVILIGADNPGAVQSAWRTLCRQAAEEVLVNVVWLKHMPQRFAPGNLTRYKPWFKKRKERTQRRRLKRYHTSAFLVNYPLGQPPSNRPTLEGYLRLPPRLKAVRGGGGAGATAEWLAPGVAKQYTEEATATDERDAYEIGLGLNEAIFEGLVSGRVRMRKRAAKAGFFTRENLMRMKTYDLSYANFAA